MASIWTTGQAFPATHGRCYEVAFGVVPHQQQTGHWTARIRIYGPTPDRWIDMDTGAPLHAELALHSIQAFREIRGDGR
jgi:hypothetical protein